MTKPTWKSRPTANKRDKLFMSYSVARAKGVPGGRARLFAGYYTERVSQGLNVWDHIPARTTVYPDPLYFTSRVEAYTGKVRLWDGEKGVTRLLQSVERGGWQVERGRNVANYLFSFYQHHRFWLEGVTDTRAHEMATRIAEGDYDLVPMLYDRLLEGGYTSQAALYVP